MSGIVNPPAELLELMARVKGFMPDDEGAALHAAAQRSFTGGVGVEIGTYCGKSAILLGHAAQLTGSTLVTIDHHRGSEEHQPGWEYHDPTLVGDDGRFDTSPRMRRALADAGLEDVVVPVIGRSSQVARWWTTPLDFVFIDGGHTDEAARSDYEGWAGRVRTGGGLFIHDVFADPAEGGQAPYRIWRRAVDSGDFVEDGHCRSLRILRRV